MLSARRVAVEVRVEKWWVSDVLLRGVSEVERVKEVGKAWGGGTGGAGGGAGMVR